MEIRDTGEYAHRRTIIKDAQDDLGATSMTKAVLAACEHTTRDVENKRRALAYLETNVPGQHAREVAEILSTPQVPVRYDALTAVGKGAD